MRPDSHTQLLNKLSVFSFILFIFGFFGDVAFLEYFRTIAVSSLYGEYVVRFPFRVVFFYFVTIG